MNPKYSFYEMQLLSYYNIDFNFARSLKICNFHREFPTSKETLFYLASEYKKLGREDLSIPILKKILLYDLKQISSIELFTACFKIAKFSIKLKYIDLCNEMISFCQSYLKVLDTSKYICIQDYLRKIQWLEENKKNIIMESKFKLNQNKSAALIEKGKNIFYSKNPNYNKAEKYFAKSLLYKYSEEAFIFLALCKMKKRNYQESLIYSKIYLGLINLTDTIIEEDRLKLSLIYIKSLIELGFYEMAMEEISYFQNLSGNTAKFQETFEKYLNECKYFLSVNLRRKLKE